MPFTPVEGTIGGLLIGASVCFHLLLNGKVTGMSGLCNGALNVKNLQQNPKDWIYRVVYLCGLMTTGFLVYTNPVLSSSSFNDAPISNEKLSSLLVHGIAGFLVGFGTITGCGCTSGHMICGLARLSKRSFVATMTFCGAAFALVKFFRSIDYIAQIYNIPSSSSLVTQYPPQQVQSTMVTALVAVVAIYFVAWAVLSTLPANVRKMAFLPITFFNGAVFGLGLCFSGMTKAQKVLGFFDIAGPYWDPSLVCVAGGAIMPSMIIFQTYILKREAPVVASSFDLPRSTEITRSLIVGALLFGIGWGLTGICPGPLVVNLGRVALPMETSIFALSMAAGMIFDSLGIVKI